ncbi:MAG: polysaccharide deacetylase family protein [Ignavibacteriaceae bacterium]
MKFYYDPPFVVKIFFKDFVWNTSDKKILFTFDDGPLPETTPVVLKTLAEFKIKSLFFCVGDNAKNNSGLISEILSEGHEIGNHTFHHKVITRLKVNELKEQIILFNRLLYDENNYKVKYFRPPHGRFDMRIKKILNEMDLKNVMWSLLTYDYKNDLNLVNFAVKKYLKYNSIVVLHDSLKSKDIVIDSIKIIMEEADRKGYEIGEPSECLK